MYLVKTKRSPFYQIAYKNEKGKLTSISTGTKIKAEALKFLSELKAKTGLVNNKSTIQFSKFKIEYLEYIEPKLSAKYVKAVSVSLNQFEAFTGDVMLNKIEFKQAEKFILKVYAGSKFMAAANYRILKGAFSKACEWKYISENPFKKFKLPKLPKSLPVFINQDELNLILEKTKLPLMKDIFSTAFYTGLRQGEILNLRWNMIDFDKRMITLKQSDSFNTKSKRERVIPINETLLSILKRIAFNRKNISDDNLVFTKKNNEVVTGDWVTKSFKRSVKAAGLNNAIHFHTLRHSFASCLIQSGVSLYVVKELLGHKDFATTQIYSHVQTKNLADAVKKLDRVKVEINSSNEIRSNRFPFIKYDICVN